MQKVILASQSPRRRELLKSLDMNFTTCAPRCDEHFDEHLSIEEALQEVALKKAQAVQGLHPNNVIIGADTIVVIDHQILGKPKNREDAKRMLQLLSGRTHHVYTGVAILHKEKWDTFYEDSEVTFYELQEEMIDTYIETKEPEDKAGAYGIQGKGCILVKKINGDYYNIVGLPLASLQRHLNKFL